MYRTTLALDDELHRQLKRTAVDRRRPMRVLVEEAIRAYLGLPGKTRTNKPPKFGVYKLGVIGSLRREDIYAEHLRHKIQ
ncbi:MAG: hypothetical protein HYY90_04725 [Candidatus Omnitrophica bacterium]|nr:hypothetical protein [Candidatus Omnitrophota bacterium]MBI3021468.1 hypothetical protein [Candidatus Omnitrophota bacterium]MBI3083648.1 hypothetical protein [Candidatus Omnitrophota bacterium]